MKILYHHRIGSKDGQYVHIQEMVDALRAEGHEVCLVGPEGFDEREFGGESGLVSKLKARIPASVYELLELGYNGVDYVRLARAIRVFEPDAIYERYNLSLLSGVLARRRSGVPLLLEINAPLFAERSAYGGLKLAGLARWSEQRAWRAADHVFAVTRVLADRVVDAGVAESRITVTPNGINHRRFGPSADVAAAKIRLGLGAQTTVIGFVGFAREWHGLDAAIELLAEYREARDLHFLLVGDGPVTEALRRQAEDAGVADRVTVTGVVDRDAVQNYVNAFDVAMLPNVVAYASPLKLFEYMACGKAIIAPDQPNLTEILTDGHDAVLFEPGSRPAFKTAMRRLIEDDSLRVRLAATARDTLVPRDLSWSANARRVASIAADLAGATSARPGDA
ncbi:glycosyltransferase family 4 protein [Salinisphaera sp.]|uniref:glycosyltransferase family 4 protein n=1 Tax=Salinisphaera sp. TaxID=1914330 RepID=UPI002D76C75E|nr:glycosyltransferase family 4 protein [Salinisphaera sp.]HET7313715.1 glycosyltransferase family 4 protein [Salinisphaera sp.]